MTEKFCKFCGQKTDTPCVDETDLMIYSRTVERCNDANLARAAELFYDGDRDCPQVNEVPHD
jgi:hypothetical protein